MHLTSNMDSHLYHIHGIISQGNNVNIHPQMPKHIFRHGTHMHLNIHLIMAYLIIYLVFHALYNERQYTSYGNSIKQGSKIRFIQRQHASTKHVHHIKFIIKIKCMFIQLCMTYLTYLTVLSS